MTDIHIDASQSLHDTMLPVNEYRMAPHPYGQQYAAYPDPFIADLHQALYQHNEHIHDAHIMIIAINNLPMVISGYGHDTTEEAILAFTTTLTHSLSPLGELQPHRIQKEQIAFIIYPADMSQSDTLERQFKQQVREFHYASSYGAIHLLCDIVTIQLDESVSTISDVIDQAYIALKQKTLTPHYDMPENHNEAFHNRQEMNMVNYLTEAINKQQLSLAFQPIVCSRTGHIEHYEALLRIKKEDGTLATAGPLIPVAERMGLIDIIDELVLDMVVKQLRSSPNLHLAFNVSNLTTSSAVWLKKMERISIETPDIMPRIMVEITETAVHLDIKRTAYFVAALQSFGALVALDDFGSGYTSFRQLKTLSVDIIKIDGVFVKDLVDNHDNLLFIKTMLDFTNGFGLKTVAEFVENGETAKLLMKLGVEYLQGYYFGFPERMEHWEGD